MLLHNDIETQIQGIELLSCFDDEFIHACIDSFATPPIDPKSKALQEPYYTNLWYLCFCAERGQDSWLRILDLDVVQLPENIGKMKGVWELRATDPEPEQLKKLPKIYSCSVSEDFPKWLQYVPEIEYVTCDEFEQNHLPDWILSADNIRNIFIEPYDEGQDFELPCHLSDNTASLDICSLNIMNPEILETIKYGLVINYSDLHKIPEGREEIIYGLSFFNQQDTFDTLPERIRLYPNIEVLYIGDQRLHSFPDMIRTMTKIRRVYLFGNPIKELPHWLSEVRTLQYLGFNKSQSFLEREIAKNTELSQKCMLWQEDHGLKGVWIYDK